MPQQLEDLVRQLRTLLPQLQELVALLRAVLEPGPVLLRAIRFLTDPLRTFMDAYLFSTRDVIGGQEFTRMAAITAIEPYLAAIADAALAAVLVWGGYRLMWSHSARGLYNVRILFPRALLAIILINFALPLFQAVVDAENIVCDTIRGIPLGFSWTGNLWALAAADDPGGVPAVTILTICALYGGYAIFFLAYAVRYALLVVLAVTAPLAGLLFVLPDTHHYAREWASLFVSTLFMQPLQLLVLAIGFRLENDTLHAGLTPMRHLFALACLLIAFKVPGALQSTSQLGNRAVAEAKHLATLAFHPRHVA